MHYAIVVVSALLLSVGLYLSGIVKAKAMDTEHADQKTSIKAADEGADLMYYPALTREELHRRLKKLAKTPAPKDLAIGAMCYKVAYSPSREEYICPTCGERTFYGTWEEEKKNLRPAKMGLAILVAEIPTCRRLVKQIKNLRLKLDESEFCAKCRPQVSEPSLTLVLEYPGEQPHVVRGIRRMDLQLLEEFLSGKNKHVWDNDGEEPLKKYIDRLDKLLGLNRGDK